MPRSDGGPELGAAVLAEVIRVIAAVDPALAQVPQGHFLMMDVLAVWGAGEQRRRLFGEVLGGARFGNGLAERGGLHAQDLKTRLTGGRLTGRKYYTTGSLTARWIGATALDDNGAHARQPRSGGLEVPSRWEFHAERRAPPQPWAAVR